MSATAFVHNGNFTTPPPPREIKRRQRSRETFKCPICHKLYFNPGALANHVAHHPEEDAEECNRRCLDCGAKCPPGMRSCWRHTVRGPEFAFIDYVISKGYGWTKWSAIPSAVIEEAKEAAGL